VSRPVTFFGKNGGDDETRTRDLSRDSSQYVSIFNDLGELGWHLSHCKYVTDKVIVYHVSSRILVA
jgi:hypothetical protein